MNKPIRPITSNLAKHGVDDWEAEEALIEGWARRHRDGVCYEILGRTSEGRYLQLVCEETKTEIRLFHCRDMTPAERRRYGKK